MQRKTQPESPLRENTDRPAQFAQPLLWASSPNDYLFHGIDQHEIGMVDLGGFDLEDFDIPPRFLAGKPKGACLGLFARRAPCGKETEW